MRSEPFGHRQTAADLRQSLLIHADRDPFPFEPRKGNESLSEIRIIKGNVIGGAQP
jgi:hypothetical protein